MMDDPTVEVFKCVSCPKIFVDEEFYQKHRNVSVIKSNLVNIIIFYTYLFINLFTFRFTIRNAGTNLNAPLVIDHSETT